MNWAAPLRSRNTWKTVLAPVIVLEMLHGLGEHNCRAGSLVAEYVPEIVPSGL